MPLFSERNGQTPVRVEIQLDDFDDSTRVALWNVLDIVREMLDDYNKANGERLVCSHLWTDYFGLHRDKFNGALAVWSMLKNEIISAEWFKVLDAIEVLSKALDLFALKRFSDDLRTMINHTFEKYLVGYRFVDTEITQIDSATDVEAIETALDDTSGLAGANHHLRSALSLLSDRNNPDYANSAKESLSAVESIGETLTGKNTLKPALDSLGGKGIKIHRAQLAAWKSMYGWASDEDGIRHSAQQIPDVDQATAKYTLITASAFCSYLIEAARKAGIKL